MKTSVRRTGSDATQPKERVETLMPHLSGSGALLLVTFLGIPALTNAAENIDMSKVRALAALPVKEIFRDSPVRELPRASYWKTIHESPHTGRGHVLF